MPLLFERRGEAVETSVSSSGSSQEAVRRMLVLTGDGSGRRSSPDPATKMQRGDEPAVRCQ